MGNSIAVMPPPRYIIKELSAIVIEANESAGNGVPARIEPRNEDSRGK